ncbi:glycosyl hydrolase family 88 [Christiangramia fulva]|uniref:Glycosyl hydrolase family 88 n=1 Tax=Christiangramia fulva TaxID=2126553 RepID=A0A2R3Z5X3_9FLAO|nr:glycoside hydrolase family 88 protein [Christiangramia fulva]AVR45659.1 glycosyl hydrolase family 88 [Christiangramia fulva]
MKFFLSKINFIALFLLTICTSCGNEKKTTGEEAVNTASQELIVPRDLKWSQRMMLSEMHRFPEASKLDFSDKPKWSYTNGLVLKAAQEVYEKTGKQKYYDYIYNFADTMVTDQGEIRTYDLEKQNLDMLNSGNVLLFLYPKTHKERFLKALKTLKSQIDTQPRTYDGGFWHKKRYTNQMWLDGLYMAEPFYAHYTQMFSEGEKARKAYNDVVHQFELIQQHALDPETGLLYHGWDASKEQKWANKETGTSPNFWSRAMGWYGMALVDVLDYLPEDFEGRQKLIGYLNQFADAIVKVQDDKTGLWWQVLDKGGKEGNYLEASGSSMFTYTLAKGVKKGYLPGKYIANAKKAYQGILNNLVTVDENGVVNLNQVCAVAGLGGDPYRDGTYEYYVNEKIRSNDPKGTGPFILASLQLDE